MKITTTTAPQIVAQLKAAKILVSRRPFNSGGNGGQLAAGIDEAKTAELLAQESTRGAAQDREREQVQDGVEAQHRER